MAMTAKADEQTAAPSEVPEKDSPLLDLSDAAVKKFIKTAKARGFVTLDARLGDRKSTRLNSSHAELSRMPSSA